MEVNRVYFILSLVKRVEVIFHAYQGYTNVQEVESKIILHVSFFKFIKDFVLWKTRKGNVLKEK